LVQNVVVLLIELHGVAHASLLSSFS
jgi:hypothetical protein